ncbi:helix-turn-helix domain-containing protein [Jeongeupia chitinilytica]|uniref:Ner winged helix-turn-helix DNA-binding domain-containing protein n=1 Tax=Jeongeupia chitinilytica TaxID=1041641 RepID=A0ABQ3H050_9NEIS|nr:helix-turn-helix transcriptional regulator [Jeongeupia chitinilytica]GHD63737.1 hypothetical protein GCM10007350_21820 [Jeongeupia chitinilytica]
MTKKAALEDWHPADVVCALRKQGWSLRKLSLHHGYADGGTLKCALSRPWPKAERLIAEAIGTSPAEIWPSRYRRQAAELSPEIVQMVFSAVIGTLNSPGSVAKCEVNRDAVAA